MGSILQNLQSTIIAGVVLAIVMIAVVVGWHGQGLEFAGCTFSLR